jgi:hypothetical protein
MGCVSFAFEAATITISVGVVVAVLLQGRPLDRAAAVDVPPRLAFAVQVADTWLAVVFILVVFVAIGTAFDAIARGEPLHVGDRRAVEHLLTVAASYPALIAIARRHPVPLDVVVATCDAPCAGPRA